MLEEWEAAAIYPSKKDGFSTHKNHSRGRQFFLSLHRGNYNSTQNNNNNNNISMLDVLTQYKEKKHKIESRSSK